MPIAHNPILSGFHPDPCLCRVGDDYYCANSTFEWWPGVRIHHSRDLVHWRLVAEPLTRPSQLDLVGLPDSGGIWAPCLTYAHGRFWLLYTAVRHHDGAFKDTPNLIVSAPTIEGPWSDPSFLNASGFDPSLFHDEDGRSWLVNMRWDHRRGKNPFNGVILQEFDRTSGRLIGAPRLIASGTPLGCTEGPHLMRHEGNYWLILAEGGTGWHHAVTVARSQSIDGPYTYDPRGPLLTSRDAWEHPLQKAGHASFVKTPGGDWYLAHLASRPDRPLGRCRLGRETALQRLAWPTGEFPRLAAGGNLPAERVNVDLPAHPWPAVAADTSFPGPELPPHFNSLRTPVDPSWCHLAGGLTLIGRDGPTSRFRQSRLARRMQHMELEAETELSFAPTDFQALAGLSAFYDCDLWWMLAITHDERLGRCVQIFWNNAGSAGNGPLVALPGDSPVRLRLTILHGLLRFWYALPGQLWTTLGEAADAGLISDDNFRDQQWNFTGAWVSLSCHDLSGRGTPAAFSHFAYRGSDPN